MKQVVYKCMFANMTLIFLKASILSDREEKPGVREV